MLFSSLEFIFLFLPVVVIVFHCLKQFLSFELAKIWLIAASLFFYGYWKIEYLPLIVGSIVVNYLCARFILSSQFEVGLKKAGLCAGILFNLGLLSYFKYFDFLLENLSFVLSTQFDAMNIILPLAISFFTFQQIAFLVDCFKGKVQEHHFVNYSLFVVFFPQLIAGPIVHHREMMPQFERPQTGDQYLSSLYLGLLIFSVGFFKKAFVADTFAIWANEGFASPSSLSFIDAWTSLSSYMFQLYYDFSGYSDMAIGAALMLGLRLPINFNSPYQAKDIKVFWQHWHMTLSRWFRDYFYIPIGGSRKGLTRTGVNLVLTFLLCGLWHGASWTFVLFGLINGAGLLIHRIWSANNYRLPAILGWLLAQLVFWMSIVFFRSDDVSGAIGMLLALFPIYGLDFTAKIATTYAVLWLLVFGSIAFLAKNTQQIFNYSSDASIPLAEAPSGRQAIAAGVMMGAGVVMLLAGGGKVFLYFNF